MALSLVKEAIGPQIAQAYTQRINISLIRQPNESYDTISRRAESVARAAVQRSFDSDILVTDASITITAENNGSMAPIVSVTVSRSQWQEYPDIRRWARYYPNTRSLLDFDGIAVANAERRRTEAAIPKKVVLNSITIEPYSNSSTIFRIKGSVTNHTRNSVNSVKVNYVVISGNEREGGVALIQQNTLNPGQEGFFNTEIVRDIDFTPRIQANSVEWTNKDGSSGSWQPTI